MHCMTDTFFAPCPILRPPPTTSLCIFSVRPGWDQNYIPTVHSYRFATLLCTEGAQPTPRASKKSGALRRRSYPSPKGTGLDFGAQPTPQRSALLRCTRRELGCITFPHGTIVLALPPKVHVHMQSATDGASHVMWFHLSNASSPCEALRFTTIRNGSET